MQDRTQDVRERGFGAHVLVCTNARDGEHAACAGAGGEAVYEAIRSWLRDRDVFWSGVHVARTSCLGLCSDDGAAVVIHPRNRWYSDVKPAEVPSLLASEFGPDAAQVRADAGVP